MFQNRINLIGFTGTDAQVRNTKNNRTYTTLSLATKRSWPDKQTGERVTRTEWHRLIAWGRLADFAKTLPKGSHVHVEGELRSHTYIGKDNAVRRAYEVHVGLIRKLDRAERPVSDAPSVGKSNDADAEVPF